MDWLDDEVSTVLSPKTKTKTKKPRLQEKVERKQQRKAKGAPKSAGTRRTNPDRAFGIHAPVSDGQKAVVMVKPDPLKSIVYVNRPSPVLQSGDSPCMPQPSTPDRELMLQSPSMMPPLQRDTRHLTASPFDRQTQLSNRAMVYALGEDLGGRIMFGPGNPGFRVPTIPPDAKLAVAEAVLDRGIDIVPFKQFVDPLVDAKSDPRAVVRRWSDAQLGMMATILQTSAVLDPDLYAYVLERWRARYDGLVRSTTSRNAEEQQRKLDEASKLLVRIRALEDRRFALQQQTTS